MVWDFHTIPCTIPRYHIRSYSMPATESNLWRPIISYRPHKSYCPILLRLVKIVFVHLHLVYFSPERERERERENDTCFFYMKLTGHCFFVLSVASEV